MSRRNHYWGRGDNTVRRGEVFPIRNIIEEVYYNAANLGGSSAGVGHADGEYLRRKLEGGIKNIEKNDIEGGEYEKSG